MTKTINVTPTWQGLVPVFVALIENGAPEGRKFAVDELRRMARIADRAVAARDDAGEYFDGMATTNPA